MIAKKPGFALTAILTFALGSGANTAIFRTAYIPLLRQPPYLRPEQPATLDEGRSQLSEDAIASSLPDYFDWMRQAKRFRSLVAFSFDAFLNRKKFLRGERC